MKTSLNVKGLFNIACYDKDGKLKWEKEAKNAATDEGLNKLLDVMFHGTAAIATWYIGLITGTGTLAAADTLASHAGWTEGTDYTGDRKEWTEGAANAKAITNAATVDFACSGSMTVKGAFLASAATGTSGTLFCTAAFTGGDQAVGNGDTLKVTYTVSAAAA
jgi:hypothetical protein